MRDEKDLKSVISNPEIEYEAILFFIPHPPRAKRIIGQIYSSSLRNL